MTAFTVHALPCDHCAGTGRLADSRYFDSWTRPCLDCERGVGGWEVREVRDCPECCGTGSLGNGHPRGVSRCAYCDGAGKLPALIGTLPASGTIDRESAETFAACLECVPGREVEALEHFAATEAYPDFMIEAMGTALAAEPSALELGGGR